jgi:uncharacterized protein
MADYRPYVVQSIAQIPRDQWSSLLTQAQVFTSWDFLLAMEQSGSVGGNTGWHPHHFALELEGKLVGAVPGYLKEHSYGEYVFDWAWADAYQRYGKEYYPKLLSAIPFSPVPGARLLADPEHLPALAKAWIAHAKELKVSSAHCLLGSDQELAALQQQGALLRQGVQFHWQNPSDKFQDFEHFLGALSQPKRKKIRSERRKVIDAGVSIQVLANAGEISTEQWDFFYRCYETTYRQHRSSPYLTRSFFEQLAASLPNSMVMVVASLAGKPIASSLLLRDADVLYGRYWGAIEHIPCLHFECAYYTPIEFAIGQGISRIEGGAQGEHKLARGFLPVTTGSAHWIADPMFKDAIARFLERETASMQQYGDELNERAPFTQS